MDAVAHSSIIVTRIPPTSGSSSLTFHLGEICLWGVWCLRWPQCPRPVVASPRVGPRSGAMRREGHDAVRNDELQDQLPNTHKARTALIRACLLGRRAASGVAAIISRPAVSRLAFPSVARASPGGYSGLPGQRSSCGGRRPWDGDNDAGKRASWTLDAGRRWTVAPCSTRRWLANSGAVHGGHFSQRSGLRAGVARRRRVSGCRLDS
jgi:hypothetical protein